jgi:peptidyl-prolyl cis-trans isomerase SurA
MKRHSLLLIPISALAFAAPAASEVIERVVAKVNGDIVTLSDFEQRQISALQEARVGQDRIESYLRDNNARILQDAIDELLIIQRADELGLKLRPEYVKEFIEGIKKENNLPSDEALSEQLRREGTTLEELKRSVGRQIIKRQVLQRELESKVTVTESEARADYEARLEEYTRPATVHLEEILVSSESGDARATIGEIVGRARAGEDFGDLARSVSTAPSRSAGGDLGNVSLKEMSSSIQKAIAPLKPGDVSEPVPSGDGYRIFKLVGRNEASVVPFEDVKADIQRRLMTQRGNDEYAKYVEGLRKTAIIDLRVKEVPLQVSRPVPQSTLLEPPLPDEQAAPRPAQQGPVAGPPATPPSSGDEITTTPQAAPERVAPTDAPKKDEDAHTPR